MAKSLFFYADGTLGEEAYITETDGSDASRETDIAPGAADATQDEFAAVLGEQILFPADNTDAVVETGNELYQYNTATGESSIILDINPGTSNSNPEELITSGSQVFFTAFENQGNNTGREVWVSDGTAGGTHIVRDFNPGGGTGYNNNGIVNFSGFSGMALIAADDGTGDEKLFFSDGTDLGTVTLIGESLDEFPLEDPRLEQGGQNGSNYFFSAEDSNTGDRELWMTDGSEDGTVQVADINSGGNSNPENFVSFMGQSFFVADNGSDGRELHRSNGTEGGTTIVFDINPGGGSSDPENLTVIGTGPDAKLIFSADDGSNGRELWVSDGTGSGTELVLDINDGAGDSLDFTDPPPDEHHYFARVGEGQFVFAADDGSAVGNELWISDGTTGGTELLKDIDPDAGFDSDPEYFMETGDGRAYFSAEVFSTNTNGVTPTGRELWTTDGTEEGTMLVDNIANGDDDSDPFAAAVFDVNSSPTTPSLSSSTVSEDANDGDTIGTLSSTDADNDSISFSIVSDEDSKFSIDGDDLVVDGSLDFEDDTSHSVTVEASDGNGGSSTSTFTINVSDVDEAPEDLSLSSNSIAEDASSQTIVGGLSASDPEGGSVSFSMSSNAGGLFAISGNNIVVNGDLDFETATSHSVTVEASDGNSSSSETFTINVTDVDDGGSGGGATSGSDTYTGTSDDNTFDGLGGADTINGKGGDDDLKGSSGKDDISGGAGKDDIDGGSGKDELDGGKGKDNITGGKGKDEMAGGKGDDIFIFTSSSKQGKDTITDFSIGSDMIDLSGQGLSFDSLTIKKKDGDAKIVTDNKEWILLEDISKSEVTSEMFDFG